MGELSPAKADRDLQLVTFIKELRGRPNLCLDIVFVDLRRDSDLLPDDGFLLFLCVLRLLLQVVAVLPEVAHARDGRLHVRRDLDEVVPVFLRLRERARGWDDAQLLAVRTKETHGRNADGFVDPQFGRGYRETSVIGVSMPLAARPLPVKELQVGRAYHRARESRRSRTLGHSSLVIPKITLVRRWPSASTRSFRSSPSLVAPRRAIAFCERSF